MFEVHELSVRAGGAALRHAELSLATGEVAGLLGDGASLLVRTVAGLLVPAAGTVRLDGEDLTGLPPATVAAHGVTFVAAAAPVPGTLTVAENLARGTATRGAATRGAASGGSTERGARVARVLAAFPALRADARGDALGADDAALLAVAVAAARGARLLLVDGLAAACEPAAYAAALAGLRALVAGDDAMALLAEAGGDPAAYDRAYLIRDGDVREWRTDPG